MNNQWFPKVAVWFVIAMVLFAVFKQITPSASAGATELGYSEFLDLVRAKRVKTAQIQEGPGGSEIIAETEEEKKYYASALRRRQLRLILAGKMKPDDATELKALFIKEEGE